jgi:hypothetical protein
MDLEQLVENFMSNVHTEMVMLYLDEYFALARLY